MIYIATVSTGSFDFVGVDSTQDDLYRSLLQAWRNHCRERPLAERGLMAGMLREGEVTITSIELGTVLRDGSPIRTPA